MADDFECLKKLILSRQSVRVFNGQPLEPGVLETILGYALRTPTSLNLQPYRVIIVRDQEKRSLLASCMSENNAKKVACSGASLIICSDIDKTSCVKDYGVCIYGDDWKSKLKLINVYATFTYYTNTLFNFFFGWINDLARNIVRLFRPSGERKSMQAWSFQQNGFLMMNITLLAHSKGIASIIMCGFHEDKLREAFKIPKRFQISGVMGLGYKATNEMSPMTPRFPTEKVMFDAKWNVPL